VRDGACEDLVNRRCEVSRIERRAALMTSRDDVDD
jgi:hypothetical protein